MTKEDALGHVVRRRGDLARTADALASGRVSVGFLGGSITAPKTGTRWSDAVVAFLAAQYPDVLWTIENAALGATGSDLGCLRAGREIVARGCDVVFVEYAVNDVATLATQRRRTREGLIRQLRSAGTDVVLVYAYCPEMFADMEKGEAPDSVEDFERLARHYQLNSVWMGLHAWREVHQGLMTWNEWLPDGLHPEARGSLSYARSVEAFFKDAMETRTVLSAPASIPVPLDPLCWEHVKIIGLELPERKGPWTIRRWFGCLGMDQALHTTAPGARLKIPFEGRGLVIGFDFGQLSSEVRYRVDGGPWQQTQRDRPAWCGNSGWYRPLILADGLQRGPHIAEFEFVATSLEIGGTVTTIGLIAALL